VFPPSDFHFPIVRIGAFRYHYGLMGLGPRAVGPFFGAANEAVMTIIEVAESLESDVLVKGEGCQRKIRHVVASDLMSDVLLVDEDDMLLLTSLASDQVLRTAQIVGAVGVIVVNGKPLPSSMVNVAHDLRMTLATCKLSKYDACVAVYEALKSHPA
jgi:hypothetical protein